MGDLYNDSYVLNVSPVASFPTGAIGTRGQLIYNKELIKMLVK